MEIMNRLNKIFCAKNYEDVEEKKSWLNVLSIEVTNIDEEPEISEQEISNSRFYSN